MAQINNYFFSVTTKMFTANVQFDVELSMQMFILPTTMKYYHTISICIPIQQRQNQILHPHFPITTKYQTKEICVEIIFSGN